MERGGDAEDGHDDGLVLLVDVNLHLTDVGLFGHQGGVLIGDVGLPGPAVTPKKIWGHFGGNRAKKNPKKSPRKKSSEKDPKMTEIWPKSHKNDPKSAQNDPNLPKIP